MIQSELYASTTGEGIERLKKTPVIPISSSLLPSSVSIHSWFLANSQDFGMRIRGFDLSTVHV